MSGKGELLPVSIEGAPTHHFRGAMVVRVGRYPHQLPESDHEVQDGWNRVYTERIEG